MQSKVLLPTDGSDLALAAIDHLQRLIGPDASVLVVEVIDTVERILVQTTPAGFGFGTLGAGTAQEIVRAQREAAAGHLARARERLERAGITRVETRILEGAPGEMLVDAARAEACDVVVIATHGRSGLKRAVLGSVADYVVHHLTGIPVLLVHPPAAEDASAMPAATATAAARA